MNGALLELSAAQSTNELGPLKGSPLIHVSESSYVSMNAHALANSLGSTLYRHTLEAFEEFVETGFHPSQTQMIAVANIIADTASYYAKVSVDNRLRPPTGAVFADETSNSFAIVYQLGEQVRVTYLVNQMGQLNYRTHIAEK